MAFAIGFACLTGALLLLSLAIAIAWRFLPPTFVRHCFGADYFTTYELDYIARSNRLVRMAALMRVAAFPASGKRRGLETAWRLAPPWFIWFSRIVLPLYLVLFAALLLLIITLLLMLDGRQG
ncbi:MAG: hypothetical protein NVV60_14075 [Luteimonas sp.]|nr:hypothetical protein [Luteimonas sp.]